MKITVTIDEATIKRLIAEHVAEQLGKAVASNVRLLVKSKQNYRSLWEPAAVLVTNDEGCSEFKEAFRADPETEIKAEVESNS